MGSLRIPVEQDVPFMLRVRALVEHSENFKDSSRSPSSVWRLASIRGATHTRFEHALGVFHNAVRYLLQLGKAGPFSRDH